MRMLTCPLMWRRTSRTLASHGHTRRLSSTATCRVAFAFDLDGVVYRSGAVIPEAVEALALLRARGVPHAFVTNGGGHSEAERARKIARMIGVETVDEAQVMVTHTPLREVAAARGRERHLVVGPPARARELATSLGFEDVLTAEEAWALEPRRLASEPAAAPWPPSCPSSWTFAQSWRRLSRPAHRA